MGAMDVTSAPLVLPKGWRFMTPTTVMDAMGVIVVIVVMGAVNVIDAICYECHGCHACHGCHKQHGRQVCVDFGAQVMGADDAPTS